MEKKKWSKPECVKVKLVAEEAILAQCKTHTGGGPQTVNACLKGTCKGLGS